MLLSVFIYNHTLTPGQWAGAGVVFAGISVEAWVKRQGNTGPRISAYYVDLNARRGSRKAGCSGGNKGDTQDFIDTVSQ
jgi:hypothetical protein